MANVEKYTMVAVGHILNHIERKEGDLTQRGNEQIKPELTHLNYELLSHSNLSAMERLKQRLGEVKQLGTRQDVNVMADWVITLPQDVAPEREKEFFQHCIDFISERYGKDNIITAVVHKDETTPHLHVGFVPTVKNNDGSERLCARQCINRTELQRFHPQLQKYVEDKMQQSVAVLNGATVGGNLTIIELKMRTALQELAQTQATKSGMEQAQNIINQTLELVTETGRQFAELDKALKAKKWFGDSDKAKMNEVVKQIDTLKSTVAQTTATAQKAIAYCNDAGNGIKSSVANIQKNMDKQVAAVNRRIKRTESKANKALAFAEQKVANADKLIQDGVNQRLAELDSQIKGQKAIIDTQDQIINEKQAKITELDAALYVKTDYERQAEQNRNEFAATLTQWRSDTERKV